MMLLCLCNIIIQMYDDVTSTYDLYPAVITFFNTKPHVGISCWIGNQPPSAIGKDVNILNYLAT